MTVSSKRGFLTEEEFAKAAHTLGCSVAAVRAVAAVESGPWGAWLSSGHPTVLFERHLFHRFTGGRFSEKHNHISNPTPGGYGKALTQPHRLKEAKELDKEAAIRATSWGLFQVLGDHYKLCGYPDAETYELRMFEGVEHHLHAFVSFISASPKLVEAIQSLDWETVARLYNGPQHYKHNYAGRLATQYNRFA